MHYLILTNNILIDHRFHGHHQDGTIVILTNQVLLPVVSIHQTIYHLYTNDDVKFLHG